MTPTAASILILFAHPALEKSRVNVALGEAVAEMPGVTFCDLYERYPAFDIRVEEQQRLLSQHELIVLQHPFYWYSSPAILKEYQDLVLAHGWAYGSGGTALRGKRMLQVITTGGSESSYSPEGLNRYSVRELLRPFERTAALCGMDYLPPFIAYESLRMDADDIARHAREYRAILEALREGTLDPRIAEDEPRINCGAVVEALAAEGADV